MGTAQAEGCVFLASFYQHCYCWKSRTWRDFPVTCWLCLVFVGREKEQCFLYLFTLFDCTASLDLVEKRVGLNRDLRGSLRYSLSRRIFFFFHFSCLINGSDVGIIMNKHQAMSFRDWSLWLTRDESIQRHTRDSAPSIAVARAAHIPTVLSVQAQPCCCVKMQRYRWTVLVQISLEANTGPPLNDSLFPDKANIGTTEMTLVRSDVNW